MKFETHVAFLMGIIAFMLSELEGPKWRHVKGKGAAPYCSKQIMSLKRYQTKRFLLFDLWTLSKALGL